MNDFCDVDYQEDEHVNSRHGPEMIKVEQTKDIAPSWRIDYNLNDNNYWKQDYISYTYDC